MKGNMIIWDADDFGANRVISDQCQSHDCRDKLDEFHYHNNNFKATLFAIPAQMTYELLEWCRANSQWIELAVHGIGHTSNYECSEMTYEEFDKAIEPFLGMIEDYFVKGFKAPGWQISDGIYKWLIDHDWWVSDQAYNNSRRPGKLPAYVNNDGQFWACINGEIRQDLGLMRTLHYHTWNCVGNGVYELSDQIKEQIKDETDFKFVSEVL